MISALYITDALLTEMINGFSGHNALADSLVLALSNFGIPLMIIAVISQWWVKDHRSETRHMLLSSGLTFLLALAANQVIIQFVQRARPYTVGVTHLLGAASTDSSFPSDHSTAAFAIAFALLLNARSRYAFAFVLSAILVSLSRVYIGTHYVSDVIGGTCIAFVSSLAVMLAFRENGWLSQKAVRIF